MTDTMGDVAIRIEGLSKLYRLGQGAKYHRFTDLISGLAMAPVRAAARVFRGSSKSSTGPTISDDRFADAPAGHFWALRDINFEVNHGEAVGIIGRNGAGKSTLLKILSRITDPTRGRIALKGRIGSLLEVGTGFHPELSGRENIYLNGAILGMTRSEIKRKFDEIVAFAETERFLDTPVKHYSSGMYTRLAFAVAAHLEPEILAVDEVLAVGDAQFQKKCLGKMSEVASQGRTVLFVSHNMGAIDKFCRRVVLLNAGKVVTYTDDVRGTIKRYLSGADDEKSVAEWRNTGSQLQHPCFRPLRFFLGNEHGHLLSMPVRNDQPVYIYVEGHIDTLDPGFNLGYCLYTSGGDILYQSLSTDEDEARWPRLVRGRNLLRSEIPRRFLNESDYRLELIASLHCRGWILQAGVNSPALHLSIHGGLSDSPYWTTYRPGLIAPVMPWTVAPEPPVDTRTDVSVPASTPAGPMV